ncbi:E3 ubiquitin-protein ligase TRIM56-like isoform X2 [Littorina saxatilis]|uniref:E3 ubiquitin-protein ligase TRIM56-like isoform X2 n=1 Tax=Littorina saxatilis TaxID=31220 RepID=UPI0038B64A79
MAAAISHHECPVCHEDFKEPKILPCTHLVCRDCIITWLQKGANQGCPLCRAPIFPRNEKQPSDYGSKVDSFPTDFVTAAVVESQRLLSSPNVCVCDASVEAKLFCFQCSIKLCSSCTKSHSKSPFTQNHTLEDLGTLSADQLAKSRHSFCSNHKDKVVEIYCSKHEELICLLCATCNHRSCSDVGSVEEAAKQKREDLKKQAVVMKIKKNQAVAKIRELDEEVKVATEKFSAMEDEVRAVFDDLQKALDVKRDKINADLSQRKTAFLVERGTSKANLESYTTGLAGHVSLIGKLASAPDDAMLGIFAQLKSRLTSLQNQGVAGVICSKRKVGYLALNQAHVDQLKELLDECVHMTDSPPPPNKDAG